MSASRKLNSPSSPSRRQSALLATAAAMAASAFMAPPARAQFTLTDVHWNALTGDWAVPGNWSTGTVPGSTAGVNERAVIDFVDSGTSAPGTVQVTTDVPDPFSFSVRSGNTVNIGPGGVLSTLPEDATNPPTSDALHAIRIGDGSAGAVTITDGSLINGATTLDLRSDIYVGVTDAANSGGTGSLTMGQTTAATTSSLIKGRDIRVGNGVGSSGTFTMNGGTAQINWFLAGRAGGVGTFNLNGGTLNCANFRIGDAFPSGGVTTGTSGTLNFVGGTVNAGSEANVAVDGSTGTATHTGGTLNSANGALYVGRGGSTGTYTLDGGTVIAKGLRIGDSTNASANPTTGSFRYVSGVLTDTGDFNVGWTSGSTTSYAATGTFTHEGGTATDSGTVYVGRGANSTTVRGTGNYTLGLDAASTASLVVTSVGTGTATTGGELYVGYNGGVGTFTMNGGSITLARNGTVGYGAAVSNTVLGEAVFNHHAGTITTTAGTWTVGTQKGQGAYTIDGTGVLSVGGDLVVGGSDAQTVGTMTVSGTAASVSATGLAIGQSGGKGSLRLEAGNVSITGAGLVGQNGGAGGSAGRGVLDVTGTATLSVTGALITGGGGSLGGNNRFNSDGKITVGGGAVVNVSGALVAGERTTVSGVISIEGGSVIANSAATARTSGVGTLSVSNGTLAVTGSVTNNGTFNLTGGTTTIGGGVTGTGTLNLSPGLPLTVSRVIQGVANLGSDVAIRPNGASSGTSNITTLNLSPGVKLDLSNNKLVTAMPVGTWNGTAYTDTAGLLDTGYGTGSWNGTSGIVTSQTDATTSAATSLGIATGAQVKGLTIGQTATWGGQTISDTSTLVMYTYAGDANLNGKIDGDDYFAVDSHVGAVGGGWAKGDFDYNGTVNGDDYFLIDANAANGLGTFPTGGSIAADSVAGITAVPEPASLGVLAVAAATGIACRRRQRRRDGQGT